MVDIEMKKVEAANKQAEAIANMASGTSGKQSNSGSYIEELKELKALLDNEIITQEEFNQKKTELLSFKSFYLYDTLNQSPLSRFCE